MMLKKIPLIMVMLLLSVLTISCNRSEEEAPTDEQTPETSSPENNPPASSDNSSNPPNSQNFNSQPTTTATLIPPTSPQQRRQQIAKGRPDPYAPFPAEVNVQRPETEAEAGQPPNSSNGTTTSPVPGQQLSPTNPNAPQSTITNPQDPSVPPPPPNPEDAQAVVVSGVIQLGETPVAILTAPGDPGTRHVKAGATIAGGRVTVKSINAGTRKPFVVLEQYGQEVTKVVGETPPDEATSQS